MHANFKDILVEIASWHYPVSRDARCTQLWASCLFLNDFSATFPKSYSKLLPFLANLNYLSLIFQLL